MKRLSFSNSLKSSQGTIPNTEPLNSQLWSELDEESTQSLSGGGKIEAVIKPFKLEATGTNIAYSGVYHWW